MTNSLILDPLKPSSRTPTFHRRSFFHSRSAPVGDAPRWVVDFSWACTSNPTRWVCRLLRRLSRWFAKKTSERDGTKFRGRLKKGPLNPASSSSSFAFFAPAAINGYQLKYRRITRYVVSPRRLRVF